jgi:phosphoribosylformylglycinamidine cyclo-ligase
MNSTPEYSNSTTEGTENSSQGLTYASAGVNIEAGNETVRRIKDHVARTRIPGVLGNFGSFGGFFQLDTSAYTEPILVSGADGVGTKLKVAFALDKHDTVGIDLVAMNVNDVLCSGAKPLFFLDYLGVGKLEPHVAEHIVKGVAEGCEQAGCALIGGETAELPGLYADGEYDLAGFTVGAVEKSKIIDGSQIQAGDIVLGIPSSGLHSNGYSLARKVLEPLGFGTRLEELQTTVGEAMLVPTRIYVKPVLALLEKVTVRGIVHITGGGFYENIPRVLPEGTSCVIKRGSWPIPPLFQLIQQRGPVAEREMFTTFNMGIGLVLVVKAEDENLVRETLGEYSLDVHRIGEIATTTDKPHVELR